jgi:hypothetical protein
MVSDPGSKSTVMSEQKITLGEMRVSGVRGLLIYCSDYRCSHSTTMSADRWPDDVRLSHLVVMNLETGMDCDW